MEDIATLLYNKLSTKSTLGEKEKILLRNLVTNWFLESREDNTKRFEKILSGTKPIEDDDGDRVSNKVAAIENALDGKVPTSVLDFGAGTGEIVEAVAKHFNIPSNKAFAVEKKPMEKNANFTRVSDLKAIKSGSVDLVLLLEVLHHIHPKDRAEIMIELKRVLSPNGVFVVQEHDYPKTSGFYCSCDIYHTYWYIINGEEYDPLYLMNNKECQHVFWKIGFIPSKIDAWKGWQKIVWTAFRSLE